MKRFTKQLRRLAFAALLLAGALFFPRRALACGSGGGQGLVVLAAVTVIPAAIMDVVFTGYDITEGLNGERGSNGMAIAEIAVTAPQFFIGAAIAGQAKEWDARGPALGYAAWMAVLTLHGISTLATPKRDPTPPREEPPIPPDSAATKPTIAFAPTLIGGATSFAPGLGAVGRF